MRAIISPRMKVSRMGFKTVSEEDREDYEIWTCDVCGYSMVLNGVGGDVCCCPRCVSREYEEEGDD